MIKHLALILRSRGACELLNVTMWRGGTFALLKACPGRQAGEWLGRARGGNKKACLEAGAGAHRRQGCFRGRVTVRGREGGVSQRYEVCPEVRSAWGVVHCWGGCGCVAGGDAGQQSQGWCLAPHCGRTWVKKIRCRNLMPGLG